MNNLIIDYAKLGFEKDEINEQMHNLRGRLKEIEEIQKIIRNQIREECGRTGKTIEEME